MDTSCEIKLDEDLYSPGQILSGSVELRVGKLMKVKGIILQIEGAANTEWIESGIGRSTTYRGRHDYMCTTSYLVGSKDGNNIELLPGIHTYRFLCVLSPNLVTSLEAKHGHIRYMVKVTLERSWRFDLSYTAPFKVLRHVDLNLVNLDLRQPIKMEKAKTFWWEPCSSAPMLITAETPIAGYVPGQTIAVIIEVDNQSNKKLEELSTKLLLVVSYIVNAKVKTSISIIVQVRCAGVDKQNTGSYVQHLCVPPIPPTSNTCEILKINYFIEVEGRIYGPAFNPKIRIPIIIGTIPFDNLSSMTDPNVVQPEAFAPDTQTPSLPVDLPPPSYVNSANIQDEEESLEESNKVGWSESIRLI